MATTVAKAFDEFNTRLRLTLGQKMTVASRRTAVETALRSAFAGTDMPLQRLVLIGSASRGTVIRPPEDVDLLAVFDDSVVWERYKNDSQAFLYRVRNALSKTSKVEVVGARSQAVRLFYASAPWCDVAPVCPLSNAEGHMLPRGDGGWLVTDPEEQNAFLARRQSELNERLYRIARYVKAWNRAHSKHLRGFHIEVMVQAAFASLGNNSREALKMFFEQAPGLLSVNDPAGHSGDLSARMTWNQRLSATVGFQAAHERAEAALLAETSGNHREAIRLWRIVLGDGFPPTGSEPARRACTVDGRRERNAGWLGAPHSLRPRY